MSDWIEWVEPANADGDAQFCRVKVETAIKLAKEVAAARGHTYVSDDEALSDFMAIHWAQRIPEAMRPDAPAPPTEKVRYSWSLDQERYHGDFDTRDDAIAAAADEAEIADGDEFTVWTGRIVPYQSNPKWLGGWLIDRLQDEAGDECGDVADEWLADVDEEALGRAVLAVVETMDPVNFWKVKDVQEHIGQRSIEGS